MWLKVVVTFPPGTTANVAQTLTNQEDVHYMHGIVRLWILVLLTLHHCAQNTDKEKLLKYMEGPTFLDSQKESWPEGKWCPRPWQLLPEQMKTALWTHGDRLVLMPPKLGTLSLWPYSRKVWEHALLSRWYSLRTHWGSFPQFTDICPLLRLMSWTYTVLPWAVDSEIASPVRIYPRWYLDTWDRQA